MSWIILGILILITLVCTAIVAIVTEDEDASAMVFGIGSGITLLVACAWFVTWIANTDFSEKKPVVTHHKHQKAIVDTTRSMCDIKLDSIELGNFELRE